MPRKTKWVLYIEDKERRGPEDPPYRPIAVGGQLTLISCAQTVGDVLAMLGYRVEQLDEKAERLQAVKNPRGSNTIRMYMRK